MKAWQCKRYGEPVQLELVDRPAADPDVGMVRISMRAAAVNFGESLILQGKYQLSPPLPYIPGSELAGVVVAVGAGVTRFHPGDAVLAVSFRLAGGAMQEVADFEEDSVFPMPKALDFAQAAALPSNYFTVYNALVRRGTLCRGETLVVFGATGGIGVAGVQLGILLGAKVIAVGGDDTKLEALKQLGASHVLNYRTQSVVDSVKQLTDGRGADVYLDPVGGDMFDAATRAIATGGRILVVGFTSGRFATVATNRLLVKMISVIGVEGRLAIETTDAGMQDFHEMLRLADEGRIIPPVGAAYPFAEVPAAFERLSTRDVLGKIVVVKEPGNREGADIEQS